MTTYVIRFRDWFAGQWKQASGLGRIILLAFPLMLGCCFFTMVSLMLSPGQGDEPSATVQIAATRAEEEPQATDEPAEPTATATEPPTVRPSATPRPTNTPRPTSTDAPPTATQPLPTETQPPATATLPPPTATVVRVATIALPTATPLPPPPPTSTLPPPPAPTATQPPAANCDPSYPDVCIPPPPPDLDCGDISHRRFRVVGSDPHRFDGDGNGIGCESG